MAFLAGVGIGAFRLSMVSSPAGIIAVGYVLSFFTLDAWGTIYAITPEVYPTGIRATDLGRAAGFGRLASTTALLSVPVLPQHMSAAGVFTTLAGTFTFAMASGLLLRETKASALV